MNTIVSIKLAAQIVGIPTSWLLERVATRQMPNDDRGMMVEDVLEAAKDYPRDERAEHMRMRRLRLET